MNWKTLIAALSVLCVALSIGCADREAEQRAKKMEEALMQQSGMQNDPSKAMPQAPVQGQQGK
jgi:proteasome assembly chaperone (PAC2) family protein